MMMMVSCKNGGRWGQIKTQLKTTSLQVQPAQPVSKNTSLKIGWRGPIIKSVLKGVCLSVCQ